MFKRLVLFSVISIMCLSLSGCALMAAKKGVDAIKKDLASTDAPTPTSSLPDKKGKTIGEMLDDIGEGLSNIAEDLGSSIGNAGSKLADDLGTSLGEAGNKICDNLEDQESDSSKSEKTDRNEKDVSPSPAAVDEFLDKSVVDDVKDIAKNGIEYIKGDKGETPTDVPTEITDIPTGTEDTDEPVLEGPYHVSWVSDGDTVKFKEWGSDVRVRLIGIDTPESVASDEYLEKSGKQNTQEGKDASSFMKEYLPKGTVCYIERDIETQDRYGRELVYLYAEKDGSLVFINELLLKEGLAKLFTLQPNSKYADNVFLEAQRYARENGKGFWGTGYFEE